MPEQPRPAHTTHAAAPYLQTVLKVLGGSVAAQAIPLLVLLLLTRLVSVEALGVFSIWQSVIYIAMVLASARMDILLVSLPAASDRHLAFKIGMISSIGIGLLLSLAACLLTDLINSRLPGWQLSASVLLGMGVWALAMQTLWLSLAIASGAFGVVNRIRITSAGLTAVLQVILVWFRPEPMMLMLGFVLGTSCGSWAAWAGLSHHPANQAGTTTIDTDRWTPASGCRDLLKKHGRIPMIAMPAALINAVAQQLPLMLTGVRFGEEAAGFLGLAWRSISAPMSIISNSAQDVFKKKAADEYNRSGQCRAAYLQTLRLLAFLAIFPSAVLFWWGPDLFALAFGDKFRPAGEVARIFAPLLYVRFFASPLGYTFLIVRQPKIDLFWQIGLLAMSATAFLVTDEAMTAFKAFSAGYAGMYVLYLILQWRAAGGRHPL